jgi:hypothetical protein
VLETKRAAQAVERRPDPLEGDAGLPDRREHHALGQPTKGIAGVPAVSARIAATSGSPRTSERPGGLRP